MRWSYYKARLSQALWAVMLHAFLHGYLSSFCLSLWLIPGKCASFLHMLHVITDLLPKWMKSLSSRWLMKSCKFFYSPIKRNRCFTSCGIKTLVQTFGSKRKKKLDYLTNTTHPGAYAAVFIDTKTDSSLTSILLFFCVSILKKYLWRKLQRES